MSTPITIDGITYDSPYLGATFKKRALDGKVILIGIKVGDIIEFGDGMSENKGIIVSMNDGKYVEVDDGGGIEMHLRLHFEFINETTVYATFQKIPN